MKKQIATIAALAAALTFSAWGQSVKQPEHPAASTATKAGAPAINTAKLWRLVVASQSAHKQLDDSPAGQAVKAADAAVQEEQQQLIKTCGDKFVLGYDQDPKSSSYQDLVCVPRPADPKPAAAPPGKANPKKE